MYAQQELIYSKNKVKSSFISQTNHLMPQLDAVIIRNLTYEAGMGRNKRVILNKINLTVPEGSIYGLLGPSGCGKTTMLRCVVGRINAKSGSVLVFGFKPGDGLGEVPGRDVGYMPQEISIYEDFTIEETLIYFGRINRMCSSEIKKRVEFLVKFLDLPSKKRLVVNLSGGQKRRVSLAAALVHSPPLLILDEPTVGVDPLLRQSIWKHLVTLTQTERISVIITTHYIEEARQANVVGLMRHGKILAENNPNELMRIHQLDNLEDVFLKLCVTDSSRRAANMAGNRGHNYSAENEEIRENGFVSSATGDGFHNFNGPLNNDSTTTKTKTKSKQQMSQLKVQRNKAPGELADYSHRWDSLNRKQQQQQKLESNLFTRPTTPVSGIVVSAIGGGGGGDVDGSQRRRLGGVKAPVLIHTGTNKIELNGGAYINEAIENFSSEDEISSSTNSGTSSSDISGDMIQTMNPHSEVTAATDDSEENNQATNYRQLIKHAGNHRDINNKINQQDGLEFFNNTSTSELHSEDYIALQAMKWASRRSNAMHLMSLQLHNNKSYTKQNTTNNNNNNNRMLAIDNIHHNSIHKNENSFFEWWKTLMAVTWKNYIRLRRNPPVLVFQFMLPAIQVILFCLCIGGDPFDVPVAIVNDELVPRSSQQFLNGLNKKIIRQVKYDNLTSAIEAVRRGTVWGAIHIPDKYSQNLQSRLIMGEEVTNETISNGTIRVYPDLTNLHLALALETTFRETFINFARNSLEELGYDRSLADLPIQVGKPVYGTMKKDGYLEFMAPGVVISISYVMATGLTALAFILERRDGLLERSLVSGVQTTQILLAHAINQVVVMVIQIFLVLGCTFFVFEIPSRGPFFWVVLLILLQGCTGMGFGLLVSAICKEENTAVMMLVGSFYTNFILAGIIWPIEAMPHWLRPLSYAQPQTLPTDTLRHILSRGWGITEAGVLLGFAVTIGWLIVFLMTAGLIFKYSR